MGTLTQMPTATDSRTADEILDQMLDEVPQLEIRTMLGVTDFQTSTDPHVSWLQVLLPFLHGGRRRQR